MISVKEAKFKVKMNKINRAKFAIQRCIPFIEQFGRVKPYVIDIEKDIFDIVSEFFNKRGYYTYMHEALRTYIVISPTKMEDI